MTALYLIVDDSFGQALPLITLYLFLNLPTMKMAGDTREVLVHTFTKKKKKSIFYNILTNTKQLHIVP